VMTYTCRGKQQAESWSARAARGAPQTQQPCCRHHGSATQPVAYYTCCHRQTLHCHD
jgi:hypothetical protein